MRAASRRWHSLHIKPAQIIGQAHFRVYIYAPWERLFPSVHTISVYPTVPLKKKLYPAAVTSQDDCRPYPLKLAQRQLIDSCHVTSNLTVDTLMNCPHRRLFSSTFPCCIDSFVCSVWLITRGGCVEMVVSTCIVMCPHKTGCYALTCTQVYVAGMCIKPWSCEDIHTPSITSIP